MKLLLIIFAMLMVLNIFATSDGCDGDYICRCQRRHDNLESDKFKLSEDELKELIKRCLSLKNFAEIILEYENMLKDKYGDSAKIKIYMTASAAETKISENEIKNLSVFLSTPRKFISCFGRHNFKVTKHGGVFMIDTEASGLENNTATFEEEDSLKYKTTRIGAEELPQDIFIIQAETVSQISEMVVMDSKKFNDWETALEYINKQPPARLINGILFRFDSKMEQDFSSILFHELLILAKMKNFPIYSFFPVNKLQEDKKEFCKYVFE